MIKELLTGFCLGAANIIPGVSGGTFLLIFNLYDRLFSILSSVNARLLKEAAGHGTHIIIHPFDRSGYSRMAAFFQEKDFFLLFKLTAGAAAAILLLSNVIKFLLAHYFVYTYAFFFGLILVSIAVPLKMITARKWYLVLFATAGMAATLLLTTAVDPYKKALEKSSVYEARYKQTVTSSPENAAIDEAAAPDLLHSSSPGDYLYISLCGAVSVSAMVLPGISGSLVLILMGEYAAIITAIAELRQLRLDSIFFLLSFATGMIIGILVFARIVSHVFKRYYNATIAFLVGLVAGSLHALWPFKQAMVIPRQFMRQEGTIVLARDVIVYSNINTLPGDVTTAIYALVCCGVGALVMSVFICRSA